MLIDYLDNGIIVDITTYIYYIVNVIWNHFEELT